MCLEARIWAFRGWTEEKKDKEEKFPLCVKAWVIGPFGAAAQKGDRPTDRPTNRHSGVQEENEKKKKKERNEEERIIRKKNK